MIDSVDVPSRISIPIETSGTTKAHLVLDKVHYPFPGRIDDVAISQHIMLIAFRGGPLYRIDMTSKNQIDVVDLDPGDGDVYRVFIDPTGTHSLISMTSGVILYWHRSWKKNRRLTRLRDIHIQSIAWNIDDIAPNLNVDITGLSLLGTVDGRIYEFCMRRNEIEDDDNSYWRLVSRLFDEEAVQGLYMVCFPQEPLKYYVMAVTVHRLYQFIGHLSMSPPLLQPTFHSLFATYEHSPHFQEISGHNLNRSHLTVARGLLTPTDNAVFDFAWITGEFNG
jgi:hypothetical protein